MENKGDEEVPRWVSGGDVGWDGGALLWDLPMMPSRTRVWQSPQPSPKPVPTGSHLPQCQTPHEGLVLSQL